MFATALAPLVASLGIVAAEPPPSEVPPGGYWTLGETRDRQREPPDGDEALTIGSVLFSLGLLRAGAGAVNAWMATRPDLCPSTSEQGCRSFGAYGWYGLAEGSAVAITGIVYLAIGSRQRAKYARWKAGDRGWLGPDRLLVGPWLSPGVGPRVGPHVLGGRAFTSGGGLRLELRF